MNSIKHLLCDDSDGTIGDLMGEIVEVLNMIADSDKKLKEYIRERLPKGEVFDWEAGFNVFNKYSN